MERNVTGMSDEDDFYTRANCRVFTVNGCTGAALIGVDRLLLRHSVPLLNHIGMIMIGVSVMGLTAFLPGFAARVELTTKKNLSKSGTPFMIKVHGDIGRNWLKTLKIWDSEGNARPQPRTNPAPPPTERDPVPPPEQRKTTGRRSRRTCDTAYRWPGKGKKAEREQSTVAIG